MKQAQIERYERQIILRDFGAAGQNRLLSSSVLVIGAGGLGCAVLPYLAGAGVGKILLMDSDVVSLSNLHRQTLFTAQDTGLSKAEVAARFLRKANPEIQIETHLYNFPLEHMDSLPKFNLILDCTDNFAARYSINSYSAQYHFPLVSGAVQEYFGQVGVFGLDGSACYQCLFPEAPKDGEYPTCSETGVLGPVVGVVGGVMAVEALKILSGVGTPLVNQLWIYDALEGSTRVLNYEKRADCISCEPTQ